MLIIVIANGKKIGHATYVFEAHTFGKSKCDSLSCQMLRFFMCRWNWVLSI